MEKMPPRTKSIFHLGDDDGGEATKTTSTVSLVREVKCMKRATEDAAEGLRILIQHKDHEGANVVIKATMKTCNQLIISQSCHHLHHHHRLPRVFPVIDFLKRCCFCAKDLKPCKDVYMYRGDQGFCSKECRNRQILMDGRREFEMKVRNRLKTSHQHSRLSTKFHASDRNRRIPAVLA